MEEMFKDKHVADQADWVMFNSAMNKVIFNVPMTWVILTFP